MNCPRCKSSIHKKNGIVNGRQRYKCHDCGYNSILRHFLARLRRKTKCYTKSIEMLKYSVLLLIKYRNRELAILN
nr:hypothetical protein [Methanosarcina horonobensis]